MLSRKKIWMATLFAVALLALAAIGSGLAQQPVADESEPAAESPVLTGDTTPAGAPDLSFPAASEAPASGTPADSRGPRVRQKSDSGVRPPGLPAQTQRMSQGRAPSGVRPPRISYGRNYPQDGLQLLGEWDPEIAKLIEADQAMDREVRDLVTRVRKETVAQKRAELRAGLEELTAKHFDLRQQQRRLQIAQMEAELERIRQEVQTLDEVKKLVVRRRVSQLLGERDELGFPPGATFRRQTPPSYGVQFPKRGQPVPENNPIPMR
jgi:hypothetical protein